jgi:hypothetical protein
MKIKEMTAYERDFARKILLTHQSEWLDEAEAAETPTLRTVAIIMADAFGKTAELYKETKETRHDGFISFIDSDDSGRPPAGVHHEGE